MEKNGTSLQLNEQTGYMESVGIPTPFDSIKKKLFIESLRANNFKIQKTCDQFGLAWRTVKNHADQDPQFKRELDESVELYTDSLEFLSRDQAMMPQNTLERMFQLKALRPARYSEKRDFTGNLKIEIKLDTNELNDARKRAEMIDAEIVNECKMIESQSASNNK